MSNVGNVTEASRVSTSLAAGWSAPTSRPGTKKRMKASTTDTVKTSEGERTRRRTTVALALRDKTLALTLSTRLAAESDAVAQICPHAEPAQVAAWLEDHPADVLLLEERWLPRLGRGTMPRLSARWPDQRVLLVGDRACTALAEQVVRNRFQGFLLATEAA